MGFNKFCKDVKGKRVGKNKCMVGKLVIKNEPAFFGHKTSSQDYKVMTPNKFLSLVPPEPFKNKEHQEKITDSIKQGKPLEPAFLDVDIDSCKVLSHEGRNRAIASKNAGIKKYPVIIYKKEFDKDAEGMFGNKGVHFYTDRKNKCKSLKRQSF